MSPSEGSFTYPLAVSWVLRALGLLLIYVALAYETEQKRVKHYLESLWIHVDDLQQSGLRRQTAFMHVVARTVGGWFDVLFGSRLLSFQAAGTSVALAMSSILLIGLVGKYPVLPFGPAWVMAPQWVEREQYVAAIIAIVLFMSVAIFNSRFPSRARFHFSVILLLTTTYFVFLIWTNSRSYFNTRVPMWYFRASYGPFYGALLGSSFVADLLFVIFTRYLLAVVGKVRSFLGCSVLIFGNISVAAGLVILPLKVHRVVLALVSNSKIFSNESAFTLFNSSYVFGTTFAASNIWDGLLASVTVLLATLMLAHLLLWPMIAKPLYLVASEDLKKHRMKLILTGVALLASTSPAFSSAVALVRRLGSMP